MAKNKSKANNKSKETLSWDVLNDLRVEVIKTIGESHIGFMDFAQSYQSLIETDVKIKELVEGVNKTFEDLVIRAIEVSKQHLVSGDTFQGTAVFRGGVIKSDDYEATCAFAKIYSEYMEIQHATLDITTKSVTELSILIGKLSNDEEFVKAVEKEVAPAAETVAVMGDSIGELKNLAEKLGE